MNALTGTAALTRLALRRDRINLPAWVLGLAGFTAGITAMSASGFRNAADLVQETVLMATSPTMRLLGLCLRRQHRRVHDDPGATLRLRCWPR